MSSFSVAERLAKLRKANNQTIHSELKETSTPLHSFLVIYNKLDLRTSYHRKEAASLLYKYLSPIIIPNISEKLLPTILPGVINTGDLFDLARLLRHSSPDDNDIKSIMKQHRYIEKVIIYLTCKEVIKA